MAANQRSRQTNSASTKKNITGKTSAGRKTTSTRKKTAGSRQQASRRNASSAQKNRRTSRMQVQDYDEPIGDEIKLIVILAVSILVLLSVFGIGGRVGNKAADIFFGLMVLWPMHCLFSFLSAVPFTSPIAAAALHGSNLVQPLYFQ